MVLKCIIRVVMNFANASHKFANASHKKEKKDASSDKSFFFWLASVRAIRGGQTKIQMGIVSQILDTASDFDYNVDEQIMFFLS